MPNNELVGGGRPKAVAAARLIRMVLVTCILLAVVTFGLKSCGILAHKDNTVVPSRFRTLTLYDIDPFRDKADDRLAGVTHRVVPEDVVQQIFSETEHERSAILSKGSLLGIARDSENSEYRVAFSMSRGSFVIIGEAGQYQMKGDSRAAWESFLSETLSDHFIPARAKRLRPGKGGQAEK